jgi:hypothetical protein
MAARDHGRVVKPGCEHQRLPNQTDQEFADAIAREAGENVYVHIDHENRRVYSVRVSDDPRIDEHPDDGFFIIGLCDSTTEGRGPDNE